MGGNIMSIFGGASQAANESSFDEIQTRADRAVEAVREHKHMDRPMPCGYVHFDVVEAIDANHAMSRVAYQFARTFSRQVFAACLSSCLLGGAGTGMILHFVQKNDQERAIKAAVEHAMTRHPTTGEFASAASPSGGPL